MEQRYQKVKKMVLFALVIVLFAAVFIFLTIQKGSIQLLQKNTVEAATQTETGDSKEESELQGNEDTIEEAITAEEISYQEEKYATSHTEENAPEALTDEITRISDVYAEENTIVIFRCFYPDAVKYSWEYYDMSKREWSMASQEDVTQGKDELYREVSSFLITATPDNHEMMIRCTVDFEGKETEVDTAKLYVLDEQIIDVKIEDYNTDSGRYVDVREIPVTVTFADKTQETVTGLNGLCFVHSEESSEYSTSISGNAVETVTKIITSCEYSFLDLEEKETMLRYQNGDFIKEISMKLIGEDISAPEILNCEISEFEISRIDEPVPVTVSIEAVDDSTPYPMLEYAFLLEGAEPQDTDWRREDSFVTDITKNGTWVAYCRDQSGNMASFEKDIIAVDNKAPYVSVTLANETWCKENTIMVNATDGLSVEYCFTCAETGEDSRWINRNEYAVRQNGIWKIKVRDAAGNMTEKEIQVSNIDNQIPVIKGITEK